MYNVRAALHLEAAAAVACQVVFQYSTSVHGEVAEPYLHTAAAGFGGSAAAPNHSTVLHGEASVSAIANHTAAGKRNSRCQAWHIRISAQNDMRQSQLRGGVAMRWGGSAAG